MHGWEGRKGSWSWLVVVRSLWSGIAPCEISRKYKAATAAVSVARGLQLGLQGKEEVESTVPVRARLGYIEAEDGGDVVGGEYYIILLSKGLVGLGSRDLRDVLWELILAVSEIIWATGASRWSPSVSSKRTFGYKLKRSSQVGSEEESESDDSLHSKNRERERMVNFQWAKQGEGNVPIEY